MVIFVLYTLKVARNPKVVLKIRTLKGWMAYVFEDAADFTGVYNIGRYSETVSFKTGEMEDLATP